MISLKQSVREKSARWSGENVCCMYNAGLKTPYTVAWPPLCFLADAHSSTHTNKHCFRCPFSIVIGHIDSFARSSNKTGNELKGDAQCSIYSYIGITQIIYVCERNNDETSFDQF